MTAPLRSIGWSGAAAGALLGGSPTDFLHNLGGPAVIRIPGRDRSRRRALVTLVHGNEPSGVRAVYRWLGQPPVVPAVDALVIVASVGAAVAPPGFAHRMLPGARDLNRCFAPPYADADGRLAEAILTVVREARPECVLDLHNNTGRNPAYGVVTGVDLARRRLVQLFADRAMSIPRGLGTLTEVLDPEVPAVAIECGRAGDPAADACAYEGVQRLFGRSDLDTGAGDVALFSDPVRVRVADGLSLAFADQPRGDADLTLVEHIDRYNFDTVAAGQRLGWSSSRGLPLVARDAEGHDRAPALFELRDGSLLARQPLVPVMLTTDPRAAVDDCVCYLVTPGLGVT